MKTIYKYECTVDDRFELEMPFNAEIIKVAVQVPNVGQDRKFCIWAMVDSEEEKETRCFQIVGTGNPIDDDMEFVESFIDGDFVWHLFQESN